MPNCNKGFFNLGKTRSQPAKPLSGPSGKTRACSGYLFDKSYFSKRPRHGTFLVAAFTRHDWNGRKRRTMAMKETPDRPHERRSTEKLRHYWTGLSQGEAVPDINGIAIQPGDPEWRKRFLLKEDTDLPMSVFIFCGESVTALFNDPPLAKPLLQVAPPHLKKDLARVQGDMSPSFQAIESGGSYWNRGEKVRYRYILLPLNSPTQEHGYIVGAYSSSAQSPEAADQTGRH